MGDRKRLRNPQPGQRALARDGRNYRAGTVLAVWPVDGPDDFPMATMDLDVGYAVNVPVKNLFRECA
jgi:hypothetical protein